MTVIEIRSVRKCTNKCYAISDLMLTVSFDISS